MTALSKESRVLFRTARTAMSPSSADRERVRARLAAKLGAAAAGAATGATIAKAAGGAAAGGTGAGAGAGVGLAAKGGALALVAKIAAPVVIAGAAATATAVHVSDLRAPHVSTATAVSSAHSTSATTVTTATTATTATPIATDAPAPIPTMTADALPEAKPVRREATTRPRSVAGPSATAAASEEEAALVDEIERALRSGDAATASRLAAEHERRFPRGMLVQEREGARVLARCMTGMRASSGADGFLAAHPRSPMRARILAACATSSDESREK